MNKDQQIKKSVVGQLNWDLRVDASEIRVKVRNCVVFLSGSVPTYPIQLAIHKNIWLVPGVKDLTDETVVDVNEDLSCQNDGELAALVKNVLLWLPNINVLKIRVEVNQSWVTLSGQVKWYWQKCQLEKIASTVPGISGVTNKLIVRRPKGLSDEIIQKNILTFLKNKIGGGTSLIDIKVRNGIVYLSGIASNLKIYQEIYSAAIFTAGVISIYEKISLPR